MYQALYGVFSVLLILMIFGCIVSDIVDAKTGDKVMVYVLVQCHGLCYGLMSWFFIMVQYCSS